MAFRHLTLALVVLAVLPASAAASSSTSILVQREAGLSAAERADIRSDAGVKLVQALPVPRTEVVSTPAGREDAALAALGRDPDVRWAIAAPVVRPAAAPNDPRLGDQWAIEQPSDLDLDGLGAWTLATGIGQTVAVTDTGVRGSHEDLQANLVPGYDYVDEDANPQDLDGHGTHVSGIVAAVANNGLGVAGLAYGAKVQPLRVLGDADSFAHVLEAFDDAGDDGIRVVNASLGTDPIDPADPDIPIIEDLINDVVEAHPNTLYVVAAGNDDNNDNDDWPVFPCSATAENILCVGASSRTDSISSYSNVGRSAVDVFAPGDDIVSTDRDSNNDYHTMSGTSMAAPQVSAIAALLLEEDATLTALRIKQAILSSASPLPFPEQKSVTDGRVNAYSALLWLAVDTDGDSVLNEQDNCWNVVNLDQKDIDSDGHGDACDSDDDGDRVADAFDSCPVVPGQPRYGGCAAPPTGPITPTPTPTPTPPADRDLDLIYDVSDACPTAYARTKDGCPLPQISSLSARTKRKTVTVRVRTSRDAAVRITIERKKGKRWVRVARKTKTTTGGRASLTVKRLKRGTHRVVITVRNSSGSGTARSKSFRVR